MPSVLGEIIALAPALRPVGAERGRRRGHAPPPPDPTVAWARRGGAGDRLAGWEGPGAPVGIVRVPQELHLGLERWERGPGGGADWGRIEKGDGEGG